MGGPPITDEQASGWESLAARCATLPTQDLPWAVASAAAFGGDVAPFVQGAAASPNAIAPLALDGNRLGLLGSEMYEPSDLLCDSAAALQALARRLVEHGAALTLARIPSDSTSVAALREAVGGRGIVRVDAGSGHPQIELGERWQEVGGGLSSSRRSALRRSRRKAEQIGPLSVDLLEPTVTELPPLLDEALAVEARSWKGDAGTALAQDSPRATFVRRYAEEAAARGMLRLQFLRLGEVPVAMQIGIEWKRQLWLIKIGYDQAYSAVSPGQLLLAESIADAARSGLRAYQLLGEAAGWTRAWTTDERSCVNVRVYPASSRAAIALTGDMGVVLGRAGRRHLGQVRKSVGEKAASRYVAGPELRDALREEARYAGVGYRTTVGFWGRADTPAREAGRQCFAIAEALPPGSELSIKLQALGGDGPLLDDLLDRCIERGIGLHFDALGPETAEAALNSALRLVERAPGAVGFTLTGRWRRSVADARRLAGSPMKVRVVKSEWADPEDPDRDPVGGYLEVVDVLAGQVPSVAVATHDGGLAAAAFDRLAMADTDRELQVLHAMNGRQAILGARRREMPVRVYVPFGYGRVPYEAGAILRRPSLAARAAFDTLPLRPWLSRKLLLLGAR